MSKEDLERIFNKEKGYYNSYSGFEELICNVCGKIIHLDIGGFEIEQEVTDDGKFLTFCPKCKKLPNKIQLSKVY